jgi:hypothetical protein
VSLPVCSTSRCNSTPGGRRQSRRLPHRCEDCPKVLSLWVPSLENLSCRGSKRTTRSDATHLCLRLPSGLDSCLAFFYPSIGEDKWRASRACKRFPLWVISGQFPCRKLSPRGCRLWAAPLLDKLARRGKSHSNGLRIEITLALGSSQYLPSVKSQFGTKSSSRLFLVQGKLMGGRARKHLRENSRVQDRTHSSGEDALTVGGVGSRRTCNSVLDSDLTDAGQRPNCTGSGADNGSLCLYDGSTQFIRRTLIPRLLRQLDIGLVERDFKFDRR